MFKPLLLLAAILFAAFAIAPAHAAIKGETFTYKHGDVTLEGYVALDDATGALRPGILLVHDWMGVRDLNQRHAREIAALGYVVLVADMYGQGVRPKNPTEAAAQAGRFRGDRALMRARAGAGLAALGAMPQVDAKKLGAMGYCFGGAVAVELARAGAPISGALSIHGSFDTVGIENVKPIAARVLMLHGADDPNAKPAQVEAFQNEMRAAKADYQIVFYGGAMHSFTNPQANAPERGNAYNAQADRRSFIDLAQFWAETFANPIP